MPETTHTLFYSPTNIARQFLYVREVPPNKGLRVEAIQKWSGGQSGDSYCCEFVTMVLDICFQGNSPIPRFQACEDVHKLAVKNGWLTTNPSRDDLFLYVDPVSGIAHHIGIITENGGSEGIAANTSPDGTSSNGTGIFEHSISYDHSKVKYVSYPR